MKRREAREKALQALFQIELNEMSLDQAIKTSWKTSKTTIWKN